MGCSRGGTGGFQRVGGGGSWQEAQSREWGVLLPVLGEEERGAEVLGGEQAGVWEGADLAGDKWRRE